MDEKNEKIDKKKTKKFKKENELVANIAMKILTNSPNFTKKELDEMLR